MGYENSLIVNSLKKALYKMKNNKISNVRRNKGVAKYHDGKFIVYLSDTLIPIRFSLGCSRLGKADVGFFLNGDRLGVYIEQIGSGEENLLTHAEDSIAVTMSSFAHDVPLSMCDFFLSTTLLAEKRKDSFVLARICENRELEFIELTAEIEKRVRYFVNSVKRINISS